MIGLVLATPETPALFAPLLEILRFRTTASPLPPRSKPSPRAAATTWFWLVVPQHALGRMGLYNISTLADHNFTTGHGRHLDDPTATHMVRRRILFPNPAGLGKQVPTRRHPRGCQTWRSAKRPGRFPACCNRTCVPPDKIPGLAQIS